jgi:acetyltransferase-like isoleucine patch superfamily enzyme
LGIINIHDRVSIVGSCTISAAQSIIIERDVLIARNVYISDHSHKADNFPIPIKDQGIEKIAPVLIKQGSWLGQNCVIGPGVTIGAGSVVGANSLVNHDIPDLSVAAGSPVKILKSIIPKEKTTKHD